ncbi:hypothetical protein [Herpetosiphon giganteus]|uniref:hypothetical protein n=1 Tax=Herpetosiphon giganteus TaxID=2029754 RepID=UPI00195A74F1|nr:hypothetical protein [Herpetosiphon giganteus]MBM7843561.1 hypothetical protein [Herpetosiphon giganteus]
MAVSMNIEFVMIPHQFGGRKYPFAKNIYSQVRWQRYFYQAPNSVRSIQLIELDYDPQTRLGHAFCIFPFDDPFPEAWLEPGELLELCEGAHIVAIAKIVPPRIVKEQD